MSRVLAMVHHLSDAVMIVLLMWFMWRARRQKPGVPQFLLDMTPAERDEFIHRYNQ